MGRASTGLGVLVMLALAGGAGAATHAEQRQALSLKRVVAGLDAPLHVTAPASEPGRLYVVEQGGRILVVERGRVRPEPFLDIRPLVVSGGEQGLLSVAFHPRYERNRRLYVDYTDTAGDTRVVEYRADAARRRALPASRRQLLRIPQPYPNHNGGGLAFGPDGLLYVGMGDGGAGGDPENRAQNPSSLLGKMLTLDVDRRGARPQIDSLGLRNPWRFAFDRANGDLYIGDVGQGQWEEIDYTPRSQLSRLRNYGWDVWEGRELFEQKDPARGELVEPVAVYSHANGCSVTGGFVYRGKAVRAAVGRYFYGDYCSGIVWSLKVVDGRATGLRREPFRVDGLTSFGEDAAGELYLVSQGGTIFRLAP
jgi:glucose/arabinose dehydrogenase